MNEEVRKDRSQISEFHFKNNMNMGADIHSFAEVKRAGKWERVTEGIFSERDLNDKPSTEPFGWRSYGMFGFLADVRNYSNVPPVSRQKGLPEDSEWLNSPRKYDSDDWIAPADIQGRETNKQWYEEAYDYHSASYLTLKELIDFDYEQSFEDIRDAGFKPWQDNAKDFEGRGTITTVRDFLGTGFFEELDILKSLGAPEDVRIVFYFDN